MFKESLGVASLFLKGVSGRSEYTRQDFVPDSSWI